MMKDKNFENMDEMKVDETEVMSRPEGVGDTGGPEPEEKAPRVAVRPKDKAQRDIVAAVAKARESGTVSSELSDEDVAGIVTPVVDALYDAYEEDGTVPTREAFAERCASEDVGGVVLGMSRDPFVKRRLGGKAIAAICAGCAVVAVLVGVGVWTAVGGQTQAAPDTGVSVSEPAGMYDEGDEAQTEPDGDADEESAAETEEEAQDVTDEGESAGGSATDEGSAASGGSGSTSANKGTTTGGSGSGGGQTGSTSSGSGSGSGTSSSGSGSGSSGQQSHTHNWVPVTTTVHHDAQYKTVHHDAQYKTVHHDAVTQERHICNGCGKDITGSEDAHMESALLAGNVACGAWHTEMRTVQAAYDEQVLVQAAYDEQVLVSAAWDETVTTGYRCSTCGATK